MPAMVVSRLGLKPSGRRRLGNLDRGGLGDGAWGLGDGRLVGQDREAGAHGPFRRDQSEQRIDVQRPKMFKEED